MPGRKYSVGSAYRYGFNGQEKSTEITAGLTTAEFWEYDSRIARRWNLDPKPNISMSPYATFANNPIWISDNKGDSIWTTSETSYTRNASGKIIASVTTNTIHITGKILELSEVYTGVGGCRRALPSGDVLGQNVNNALNSNFSTSNDGKGNTVIYKVDAKFTMVKSMSQVAASDHLIVITDNVTGDADQSLSPGSKAGGIANPNSKIGYVANSKNMDWQYKSVIHELGHNFGLGHEKNGSKDIMSYDKDRQRNFNPLQLIQIFNRAKNGALNKDSNSEVSKGNSNNWFSHSSSNEEPFKKNVKKGEVIPKVIPN
jgi:hypothetical protein